MRFPALLPAIREVLTAIRQKPQLDDAIRIILEKACELAGAAHGSFVRIDHTGGRLRIVNAIGHDWTPEKLACQLRVGEGITGRAAATGQPVLCADTRLDPGYYPLFETVRSELAVPVVVLDETWGLINIDATEPGAFQAETLELLVVFAEITSHAITIHLETEEQEKLHRRLLHSEKLASLGGAVACIAHEINTPLTSVLLNASRLDATVSTAEGREITRAIITESQRAAALVKGLLGFSRHDTGRREIIDLDELIRVALAVRRSHPQRREVRYDYDPAEGRLLVEANGQQLQQVLVNLFANAEHAVAPLHWHGRIRIETFRDNTCVHIRVADNGQGIPPEIRASIFTPFVTSKPPGEGTGLGLSICQTIVTAHGGTITLEASSPKGTSFLVTLPTAPVRTPPPHHHRRPAPVHTGPLAGSVLVLDDDPGIADSLQAFLRLRNIDVRRAYTAKDALTMLREKPADLILSDLYMPEMDGLQFHEATLQIDPGYERRFVLMSGGALHDAQRTGQARPHLKWMPKPFTSDELHRVLADHLPVSR